MKQVIVIIFLVMSLSMLVGCSNNLPIPTIVPTPEPIEEPTPEPTEEPILTEIPANTLVGIDQTTLLAMDVTEGFEFSLYAMKEISLIKDKYFYVDFKEIIYQPVKNRVCIIFDYDDEDYERATYYMIGRKKGSLLTTQQLSFVLSNPTGEHGGCFTFMSEQTTYEILIGKVDRDDLNPTPQMEAVAVIEFTDTHYDQRHKLGLSTLTFGPKIEYTYDQIPSISLDITIEDAMQIIDSVVVKLFEEETNLLLETYTIPSNLLTWQANQLIINDYVIPDLAPYVDYRVKVYVTGFNGIETFTEVDLINQTFKSQNITYSKGFRRHGFFAEIIRIEPQASSAIIHYLAVNDQNTVSSGDQEPYTFHLKIYDTEDQLVYETPIDVTQRSLSIPLNHATVGYQIKITSDRDDITLHELLIETPAPQIEFNDIVNRILSGQITSGLDAINFITLFLYENPDDPHFDEIELSQFSAQGEFSIQLPYHQMYQTAQKVFVIFQINYGDPQNPNFHSRAIWIDIE